MMNLGLLNPALLREAAPVGGRWINAGRDGIAVTNPATGEVIGHVPNLGAAETLEAIDAAQIAQKIWAARTAKDRSNVLRRWFDLMMTNQADLAKILTAEQGKPLAEASGEVGYGASFIEWFSEEARRAYGDITPGHAPFIVFDDADLDAAVDGALISKFRNNGQTCVCANRIYVQAGVYGVFAEKLVAKVAELKTGNGFDEGIFFGPLINDGAVRKVQAHVADAQAKGARVIMGGKLHAMGGTFFKPTILTGVTSDMAIATEETFGPVAPLFKFETEAEVVKAANDTDFGLASYFYSSNHARVWRVSEALEYVMVGVNTGLISTVEAPFGGMKQSGLGREGARQGLDDFLETKYI